MNIESVLKREGIEDIRPLDTLTINKIAKNIANKIANSFWEHDLSESDLFIAISRLGMYYAKLPDDLSGAKYFYKNNAIYFSDALDTNDLEEFAIHECIHYLQEVKDEKGNLIRLGLCNYKEENGKGMGINEAAVQLMAMAAMGKEPEQVKYYKMFLTTKSPDYYPLECALLNEMIYFTGNYPLYHSTLYSDNVFKNIFAQKFGIKAYKTIQKNIDTILELENDLNFQSMMIQNVDNERKVKQANQISEKYKKKIASIFIQTQDFIMKTCFDKELNRAKTMEDLMYFKDKIYRFKEIIGSTEDYTTYNDFYVQKMQELEIKKAKIENGEIIVEQETLALVDTQEKGFSFIKRILVKLGIVKDLTKAKVKTNDEY